MKYYYKYTIQELEALLKNSVSESDECLVPSLCRPGLYIGKFNLFSRNVKYEMYSTYVKI